MTLLTPNVGLVLNLQEILNRVLTLKLYSNNRTPAAGDTAGSYTEVSGGGYADVDLLYASWSISAGGIASYAPQDFTFTGATTAPAVIYGYYIVDADGVLRWAERFPGTVVPFTPVNGSLIRITPIYQAF